MLKKRWLILFSILLVLLSGCSTALASTAISNKKPTTLQVRRVNLIPPNHYLPFSPRTITNQQLVQRLYNAEQMLPKPPSGPMSCPVDLGLEFQLDFFQERTFIQEVTVDLGGCHLIQLGKRGIRQYDAAFFQLLAQTLGVSETELYPKPLYSCTPHSPCLSPIP